jgi:hypothetical protein
MFLEDLVTRYENIQSLPYNALLECEHFTNLISNLGRISNSKKKSPQLRSSNSGVLRIQRLTRNDPQLFTNPDP